MAGIETGATRSASLKRISRYGYLALFAFVGLAGAASAFVSVSSAVIANAQFVAETSVKKIQHQRGGVVALLKVEEGDKVAAGDLLIRLDDTQSRLELQLVVSQIEQFAVRVARLIAERDQSEEMAVPADFDVERGKPSFVEMMESERRLFLARRQARAGVRAQLTRRIGQLQSEIDGIQQQKDARERQLAIIKPELEGVRGLYKNNLVALTRLSALEREAASLEGVVGQLVAQRAQTEGKISETELQIIQITEDLRAEAMKELREVQARVAEMKERRIAAEDQLQRIDIRAPVSGIVHQLAVHTIGGVISPAEPAMLIFPTEDRLSLEARVAPQDIDQVHVGQGVTVRLHAFNQRTTPELKGAVERVGADAVRDPQSQMSYFVAKIRISPLELARIAPLQLVAGMQADAYIETGARTVAEYIARPFQDQFKRALRER